jgi:hypothetical protein
MTKDYEVIYRVSGNIYRQKIFCGISLILCLQMCKYGSVGYHTKPTGIGISTMLREKTNALISIKVFDPGPA